MFAFVQLTQLLHKFCACYLGGLFHQIAFSFHFNLLLQALLPPPRPLHPLHLHCHHHLLLPRQPQQVLRVWNKGGNSLINKACLFLSISDSGGRLPSPPQCPGGWNSAGQPWRWWNNLEVEKSWAYRPQTESKICKGVIKSYLCFIIWMIH